MGCRSDYQEPTGQERENSRVLACLKELKTGKMPSNFGTGGGKAYNNTTQKILDDNTAKLCKQLQGISQSKLKGCSLELQMWWRDHQKADKKRLAEELKEKKEKKDKDALIATLSPYEKKLLGV